MDKDGAKIILSESLNNLEKRRGAPLTIADLEAEVINNACVSVFMRKKLDEKKDNIFSIFSLPPFNVRDIASAFANAALELFPREYTQLQATNAILAVQQNVAWEGMLDFLRNYFQKNHGDDFMKSHSISL